MWTHSGLFVHPLTVSDRVQVATEKAVLWQSPAIRLGLWLDGYF
jgi:hypothetical protein